MGDSGAEDKQSSNSINTSNLEDIGSSKSKPTKSRARKRKRISSDSSSDDEVILPDNAVATDRTVHASAVKNNLDDASVRKLLKKVVTNDHVLALVHLREEEEDSGPEDKSFKPKLTRAKVKELKKVSPKCAAWNLENLELTPIKHIPVKTRPEVKALIAQELPEDEDDEEYEPTNDDVPSDDEHVESSSDLDSQPRTPLTPASIHSSSPKVVKDGPFKVPQEISSVRRKLDVEEATIALRTRSKLSLSSTSIEHIESTFIPPDDIPVPHVDDLWNEFLSECLNPASTSKNEDDDETDPEYNVAADPDAHDEDEEALSQSIIKISKKELNDLVTELFNIMPEDLADNLANSVLSDTTQNEVIWEGKKETVSDDEDLNAQPSASEKRQNMDTSTSESGTQNVNDIQTITNEIPVERMAESDIKVEMGNTISNKTSDPTIRISIEETTINDTAEQSDGVPPCLKQIQRKNKETSATVVVEIGSVAILPEQALLIQQQLRQHVQLATSSFLQLCVHPVHWKYAHKYKEFLQTLNQLADGKHNSIANVCNLKPAIELIATWEKTVSTDTPQNREMIEFINNDVVRSRRRFRQNNLYVGDFHETFKKVVANSPVFLYPYLLPSMPFRGDHTRRVQYLQTEDELIVLGLDQFFKYVENNPVLFKKPKNLNQRARWGLKIVLELVVKHMFPWMNVKQLNTHIGSARTNKNHVISRYFATNEVPPVKHKLLPFDPTLTLYEQPEHEMPRLWVRYLAKTSKRFKAYLRRRHHQTGQPPKGIEVSFNHQENTIKAPLPIDFTKTIPSYRSAVPILENPTEQDRYDVTVVTKPTCVAQNLYKLVETKTGAYLVAIENTSNNLNITNTVNSTSTITTPAEQKTTLLPNDLPEKSMTNTFSEHCTCCSLLRKIRKKEQKLITEYLGVKKKCVCVLNKADGVTSKLKLLIESYKDSSEVMFKELEARLNGKTSEKTENNSSLEDIGTVSSYQLKILCRVGMTKRNYVKIRVRNLFCRFNPDTDDPVRLAQKLFEVFEVDLLDLYMDFLVFLTPEQADRLNAFKHYFIRNCVKHLMDKIDEQVNSTECRQNILKQLQRVFSDNKSTACEICTYLLEPMKECPKLAEYTFSLFPHSNRDRSTQNNAVQNKSKQQETQETTEQEPSNTMDYEADHSSSGEEDQNETVLETEVFNEIIDVIKEENTEPPVDPLQNQETDDDDSQSAMTIVFDESELLKSEPCEWNRDEDKLILEVLKQQLTPEERRGITISQLLNDMNVYGIIMESLTNKSLDDVKERVAYLLSLLVLSENC